MFSFIFDLIDLILRLYKLAVVAYLALNLLAVNNKWVSKLGTIVEPALEPVRKLLHQYLPQNWQVFDWSPVALVLLVSILQWLL